MKKQLNYEWLRFHIREASEELDDLLQRIEFSMKLPSGVSKGRIDGEYTCKFCGRTFKDIRSMVLNSCLKNPTRGGKHSPAR